MKENGTTEANDTAKPNVMQAVPFFGITDMETSLRFYLEGLGCRMTYRWIDEGKLRWCWLEIGDAALMLQEYRQDGDHTFRPEGKLGQGVSICFTCRDALAIYHEVKGRGIEATRPFVGNGRWVTSVIDPDGYRLEFESLTDVPEDTIYGEEEAASQP
jgi:lactoylglutathione lyase